MGEQDINQPLQFVRLKIAQTFRRNDKAVGVRLEGLRQGSQGLGAFAFQMCFVHAMATAHLGGHVVGERGLKRAARIGMTQVHIVRTPQAGSAMQRLLDGRTASLVHSEVQDAAAHEMS